MADFQITLDADYMDKETRAKLYALTLDDMKHWCRDQMIAEGFSPGRFMTTALDNMDMYKLWCHIKELCAPEEGETR